MGKVCIIIIIIISWIGGYLNVKEKEKKKKDRVGGILEGGFDIYTDKGQIVRVTSRKKGIILSFLAIRLRKANHGNFAKHSRAITL